MVTAVENKPMKVKQKQRRQIEEAMMMNKKKSQMTTRAEPENRADTEKKSLEMGLYAGLVSDQTCDFQSESVLGKTFWTVYRLDYKTQHLCGFCCSVVSRIDSFTKTKKQI